MIFFRGCIICGGDLLLEADQERADLVCLKCDSMTSVPADTHLYEVLCDTRAA